MNSIFENRVKSQHYFVIKAKSHPSFQPFPQIQNQNKVKFIDTLICYGNVTSFSILLFKILKIF